MIDINKLRKLARAARPGVWYVERGNYVYGCKKVTDGEEEWNPVIASTDDDEVNINFEGNAKFIAAANPAVINELLDRLEEAESDALEQARLNGMGASREAAVMAKLEAAEKEAAYIKEVEFPKKAHAVATGWRTKCARLEQERDALSAELSKQQALTGAAQHIAEVAQSRANQLQARIEAMEKQEPVAWCIIDEDLAMEDDLFFNTKDEAQEFIDENRYFWVRFMPGPLYLAPGAQQAPKSVAYLDLGVGGYMDIGTDLTDEALAAIPKGRHMLGIVGTYGVDGYSPAQSAPSIPEGWLRVIDEALVVAHIGVANESDTYEQAKAKLDNLIGFHVDVATDPAVNGGWKLVPSVSEDVMRDAERYRYLRARDEGTAGVGCWLEAKGRVCDRGWLYGVQLDSAIDSFIEMLAATPEAKP